MKKFDPRIDYPVKKDLKHFEYFLKHQPIPRHTYVNKDGKKRLCVNVRYPEGAVTDQTQEYIVKKHLNDDYGEKFYHTPSASLIGQKESIVDYKEGEEYKQCTSREWLEWQGQEGEVIPPKATPVHPLAKESPEVLRRMYPVDEKNMDDISKGGKWKKPDRQKK